MQMAKFLLVAFATAAVISITLGASKYVDEVTTRVNIRISNLLGEETIWSCCCSYFCPSKISPSTVLPWRQRFCINSSYLCQALQKRGNCLPVSRRKTID